VGKGGGPGGKRFHWKEKWTWLGRGEGTCACQWTTNSGRGGEEGGKRGQKTKKNPMAKEFFIKFFLG